MASSVSPISPTSRGFENGAPHATTGPEDAQTHRAGQPGEQAFARAQGETRTQSGPDASSDRAPDASAEPSGPATGQESADQRERMSARDLGRKLLAESLGLSSKDLEDDRLAWLSIRQRSANRPINPYHPPPLSQGEIDDDKLAWHIHSHSLNLTGADVKQDRLAWEIHSHSLGLTAADVKQDELAWKIHSPALTATDVEQDRLAWEHLARVSANRRSMNPYDPESD